jgi:glutamate racemase
MKIGVFDSGVGGLTVLRALLRRVPADYVYLGDTARLPYGAKSRETVARYAVSSAKFLVEEQGAEFLVIACNTASALALDAIRDAVTVPVAGCGGDGSECGGREFQDARCAGDCDRGHRGESCIRGRVWREETTSN